MNLIPWTRPSKGLIESWREELEEMFGRFAAEPFSNGAGKAWAPRVDVGETDKEITVEADLPGVDAKDVEITVQNNILTLRGEKKEQKEEKKRNYHRLERFEGQFYRQIMLPPGADADRINATTAKGVITVVIPKKTEMQAKKITVKATE